MKKISLLILAIIVVLLCGSCFPTSKREYVKFIASLKERRYISEEYNSQREDLDEFQAIVKFHSISGIEFSKTHGENQVEDLFDISEKYGLEIKITINGEEYIVEFNKMKSLDDITNTSYIIEQLDTKLEGLSSIIFTIVDDD